MVSTKSILAKAPGWHTLTVSDSNCQRQLHEQQRLPDSPPSTDVETVSKQCLWLAVRCAL